MYRKGGEPRMEEENVARYQYAQFSVLCVSAGVRCQFEWKLPQDVRACADMSTPHVME
jgi:hypothetical protein